MLVELGSEGTDVFDDGDLNSGMYKIARGKKQRVNVYFITLGLKGKEYDDVKACQESPFRK
jgi:hypothetical protein